MDVETHTFPRSDGDTDRAKVYHIRGKLNNYEVFHLMPNSRILREPGIVHIASQVWLMDYV
jgi:hypothetical protein